MVVNDPDKAIDSLNKDVLGTAKKSDWAKFDARLGDALAEVCAVVELSLRGGTEFKRVLPSPGQTREKVPTSNIC